MSLKQSICRHFCDDYAPFYARFLEDLKPGGADNLKALCPFHPDASPSLSINAKSGTWNCKACGAKGDAFTFYAKKHGLDARAQFPEVLRGIAEAFGIEGGNGNGKQARRIVMTYDYADQAGRVVFRKNRYEPKSFSLCRPDGAGGFVNDLAGVKPVLYRLAEVVAASDVLVVEGEKDADALAALGFVATTNFDGAGKWRETYTETLAGKRVQVIPDDDEPGRKHANLVAAALHGRAASVRIVELPNPAGVKGFDVSDLIAGVGDPDQARELLGALAEAADEWAPASKPDPDEREPGEDEEPGAGAERLDLPEGLEPVEVRSAAFYLDNQPPPLDQLLTGVIDIGDKIEIVGQSKQKKSFLALTLGACAAARIPFVGIEVPRERIVLYAQMEIREHHVWRRVRRICRGMGISDKHLGGRLHVLSLRGKKGWTGLAAVEGIRIVAARLGAGLIIIDPLYKLLPEDAKENAAEGIRTVMAAFDRVAEGQSATVAYTHHDSKGNQADKSLSDRGAGSGLRNRDIDAGLYLSQADLDDDATVIEVVVRNYPPMDGFTVKWEAGEDSQGLGYCRFRRADEIPPEKRTRSCRSESKLSAYLPAALDVLGNDEKRMPIATFQACMKEAAGLGRDRCRAFVDLMTKDGESAPLVVEESRGDKLHKRSIFARRRSVEAEDRAPGANYRAPGCFL